MRYCKKKLYKCSFTPLEAYELFGEYVGKTIENLQILGYNPKQSILKHQYIFSCKCLICGKYCDKNIYHIIYGYFKDCGECSHKLWSKKKIVDICNQRYGKLTVLEQVAKPIDSKMKSRSTWWKCICDCGKETVVCKSYLRSSKYPNCGCEQYKNVKLKKSADLTNKKFGMLTALELVDDPRKTSKNRSNYWRCICECGKEHVANASCLISGSIRSCGCKANYSSFWENEIIDSIVEKYNIKYKKQYRLKYQENNKIRHFSYDCAFFIKDHKIILECNGTRYHPKQPYQLDKNDNPWKTPYGESAISKYNHDKIKINLAKCMGFDVIVVWDDESMEAILNKISSALDKIIMRC